MAMVLLCVYIHVLYVHIYNSLHRHAISYFARTQMFCYQHKYYNKHYIMQNNNTVFIATYQSIVADTKTSAGSH